MIRKLVLIFFVMTMSLISQGQKPNSILYIVDDLGWNDTEPYGNPFAKTPHPQGMANEGLKFTNAYVTTSSCSPSRCSVISGSYPHNTGAPELHNPLPSGRFMFPKLLKKSGYYTVLSGKNHMGPHVANVFDTVSRGSGLRKIGHGSSKIG